MLQCSNDATERPRGQRAVTARDYSRLGALLNEPDRVQDAGVSDAGLSLVRYTREFDGERYSAVFSIRQRRRTLALETFYIGRKKQG